MKLVSLLLVFSILLGGCARKSEIEEAHKNLAEAQRRVDVLESERVSKTQYEAAQNSLRLANEKITYLENELRLAQTHTATSAKAPGTAQPEEPSQPDAPQTAQAPKPAPATSLALLQGAYVVSNDTYVYGEGSQLALGEHLQISSPTGLLVSDPEQKIVGGDLAIKAKGMTLETNDGLLTTGSDGSVKFTGKTLTMKFDDTKSAPDETAPSPPASNPPNSDPAVAPPPATNP